MRVTLQMNAGAAISFGRKTAWLAINDSRVDRILQALQLAHVRVAGWPEGMSAAYDIHDSRAVFVTPAIAGWVLAVGVPIAELGVDHVIGLSGALASEVIRFATHRVSAYDAWIRADRGALIRAYEFADGETRIDQGAITADELALGLADGPPDQEATVLALAGTWSINPDQLESYGEVGTGWIAIAPAW
jgi:hypothetical protein